MVLALEHSFVPSHSKYQGLQSATAQTIQRSGPSGRLAVKIKHACETRHQVSAEYDDMRPSHRSRARGLTDGLSRAGVKNVLEPEKRKMRDSQSGRRDEGKIR